MQSTSTNSQSSAHTPVSDLTSFNNTLSLGYPSDFKATSMIENSVFGKNNTY